MFSTRSAFVVLAALTQAVVAQTQTHGQVVGDPTATSAVVWTRCAQVALVSVQYSVVPTLAGALETAQVPALANRDFTVRVPLAGLQPDTVYYYRCRIASALGAPGTFGPIAQFRTAPAPGAMQPISFAFSGDAQTLGEFDIFLAVAIEQPTFYLSLGDFPYCDGAASVADFWAKHRSIRGQSSWLTCAARTPLVAVWDDHEVTNNWDAAMSPGLVANGIAAFRDWMPIGDGPTEIYRSLRFGAGAELFLLDTRRFRGRNDDPPAAGKPFLGAAQRQWLQQALLQSTATWKIIATSVPTFYGGTDSWDGYVHERESLLAFLRENRIDDVVFLAADQHIAAIRELREGVLEVQAGPMAQSVGSNLHAREPEQVWHGTVRNFGMVHVDTTTLPPRLRIAFHGANGSVLREHVAAPAGRAARLQVLADAPESGFHLAGGPHLVRDGGAATRRSRLRPGDYRLLARDLPHGPGSPAAVAFTAPPDADVRIALDHEDLPSAANPLFFHDAFDAPFGPAPGWTVVDQGANGPSSWLVVDGALTQRTNIGGAGAPAYVGTLALAGDPNWTDVTVSARLRSVDNDSCGIVFRCTDGDNHYRVRLDAERSVVQLTRFVQGSPTVLASVANAPGFVPGAWHELTVTSIGSRHVVWRDGEKLFDVVDAAHPRGRIGCYAWADQIVAFDDFVVRGGDATGRTRQVQYGNDFAAGTLAGVTVIDQGTVSGPSLWSVQGGVLRQDSNIGDGDGSRAGLPKLGTVALLPPALADQELLVRVRSDDNDAIGAVVRWQDGQNHYRFSLDAERGYRRLVRVLQGTWTVLWEDQGDYLPGVWHRLGVSVRGDRIRVQWDGMTLCDVRDAALAQGRTGLYCWASTPVQWDDVLVQTPPAPRAVTVATAVGGQETIRLRAPASAGRTYLAALSQSTVPGIAMSSLQPNDLRTWPLTFDAFFDLSLQPSPFLLHFLGTLDAEGEAVATIVWPTVATQALGGLQLWAGAITWDPAQGRFGEIFPSVPVTIPN
jgi:phosphodiesterase/alkaline phosphatase D-like protein